MEDFPATSEVSWRLSRSGGEGNTGSAVATYGDGDAFDFGLLVVVHGGFFSPAMGEREMSDWGGY